MRESEQGSSYQPSSNDNRAGAPQASKDTGYYYVPKPESTGKASGVPGNTEVSSPDFNMGDYVRGEDLFSTPTQETYNNDVFIKKEEE